MGRICYFYSVLIFGGMHPPNVNLALVNFTLIVHKIKTTLSLSLSEGKKFKIINNLLHFSFIKYLHYLHIEIATAR